MSVVVMKFGGSSVAEVGKLERVADRVVATRGSGVDVVVVISAMGKTTDQLLALAHEVDPNPPRRELDMLLSTGERVSMALLSMAIQKRGCDAISFTGSQSGIITNDRHFDARIIEVRPWRIEDEIARGRVVIVAGYQGMSYKREITTLGRGGSDTTAIALAAALGADRAEIYSDVDGVYSADPRVVPDATHLPEVTYEQMQEMADAGAKVLNADAVEFARRARIAIHARSTFAEGRQTIVRATADQTQPPAVVGQRSLVRVRGPASALPAMLAAADELELTIRDSALDSGSAYLIVTSRSQELEAAQGALTARGFVVDGALGAVTVIARQISARPRIMVRAMEALERESIPTYGIQTGPLRWMALVDEARVDDAVRAIHGRRD